MRLFRHFAASRQSAPQTGRPTSAHHGDRHSSARSPAMDADMIALRIQKPGKVAIARIERAKQKPDVMLTQVGDDRLEVLGLEGGRTARARHAIFQDRRQGDRCRTNIVFHILVSAYERLAQSQHPAIKSPGARHIGDRIDKKRDAGKSWFHKQIVSCAMQPSTPQARNRRTVAWAFARHKMRWIPAETDRGPSEDGPYLAPNPTIDALEWSNVAVPTPALIARLIPA